MILTERARAKVNLTLRILGRRPDGYHALDSLVAFADDAADLLTLDTSQPPGLVVTGPYAPDLGADANLVKTAMDAVVAAFPGARLGRMTLAKHLPVAAGIGGGSADAAAALRLLRRANPETDTNPAIWQAIAERLGSDVPVCVTSHLSRMTGRGEIVTVLPSQRLPFGILVNPRVPPPANKTAEVFKALAAPPLGWPGEPDPAGPPAVLSLDLIGATTNDLEVPARRVMPIVDAVLAALRLAPGGRVVRLSGAGPTCFALFQHREEAAAAARRLCQAHPTWWVVETSLV